MRSDNPLCTHPEEGPADAVIRQTLVPHRLTGMVQPNYAPLGRGPDSSERLVGQMVSRCPIAI